MSNPPVNQSQTRPIASIILWGLYIALFYFLYLVIKPFIFPILWATILTIIFSPIHKKILEKTKRETLAASLSMTILVFLVITPGIYFAFTITTEAVDTIQQLMATRTFNLEQFVRQPWIEDTLAKFSAAIKVEGTEIKPIFAQKLRELGFSVIMTVEKAIVDVPATFVQMFVTLFTTFFMLKDGKSFGTMIRNLVPISKDEIDYYSNTLKKVIYVTFIGVLLTAFAQGLIAFAGFYFIGIKSPLLLGLLTAMASLVPVVGSALVWLPLGIYLLATGAVLKGVLVLVLGVFVIGLVDNFVRPIFLHQYLSLHLLLTFFSLIGGIQAFGIIGIFLGPIIVSGFIGSIMLYQDYKLKLSTQEQVQDGTGT